MKRSQLQAIIRETLSEVLNEETPQEATAKNRLQQAKIQYAQAQLAAAQKGNLEEEELTEMAWGISGNKLKYYQKNKPPQQVEIPANPSGNLASIINVLRQKEGEIVTDKQIQDELGFARPQMVNTQLSNVFAKAPAPPAAAQPGGPGGDEDIDDDGEEDPVRDPFDDLVKLGGYEGDRSDAEIDASFAKTMRSGEEEPEAGEIETGEISGASMSAEEREAWMRYSDLEQRLKGVRSNLNRASRSKNKPSGDDIQGGGPLYNIPSLQNTEKNIENEMAAIISKYPSFAKDYKAPEVEIPDEPEELDEWTINRLKFYAGIIK